MVEPFAPPPSRAASTRDPRTASISGGQNPEPHVRNDPSPIQSVRKGNTIFGTPEGEGSEEEITPSPNMKWVLTRLQDRKNALPEGGSSAISGPDNHLKEGVSAQSPHSCVRPSLSGCS